MFQNAVLNLSGPICRCDKEDLSWSIFRADEGGHGVTIECRTCGTKLVVAHKHFVACFRFDEGYPGGAKDDDEDEGDLVELRVKPDEDPTLDEEFDNGGSVKDW